MTDDTTPAPTSYTHADVTEFCPSCGGRVRVDAPAEDVLNG